MKRGQRKLCDIYDYNHAEREELTLSLLRAAIDFSTHRVRKTGIRFYVSSAQLRRAQDLLPLTLRGFRKVSEAKAP